MIVKGTKIGRNDACPCESGKKFKKCCEAKGVTHLATSKSSHHPLSQFDRDFLIDTFSEAFTLPQNHGKNIRLEQLVRESLLFAIPSGGSSDQERLKSVLNTSYEFNPYEDPPEHLFSDVISFFGGDYVVFPGIFSNGHFVLSNLLMALFFSKNDISDKVKASIYSKTILLLKISNEVARRNGIVRYEKGLAEDDLIAIKSEEDNKTNFIHSKLVRLWCSEYSIDYEQIYQFVLPENANLSISEPNENPIAMQPLIKVQDGFKTLSVTNLEGSLLHAIFLDLLKNDCLESALSTYADFVWHASVLSHLKRMRVAPIQIKFPENTPNVRYGAFKIDLDKIMIVLLHQDNGEKYNVRSIYSSSHLVDTDDRIVKYILELLQTTFPGDQIMIVHLSSGTGRLFGATFPKLDYPTIDMSVLDFDLIMRLREYDSLSLWNYALARTQFSKSTRLSPIIDEIDLYALYHEKGHCFYFNDDKRPDYLALLPGTALSFREEIYLSEDIHSISFIDENGASGGLICVKLPEYDRTYHPLDSSVLQKAIEGEHIPVWIRFGGDMETIEDPGIYIKMLEALGYWVWQAMESLEKHLTILPKKPITLIYDFRDRSKFEIVDDHDTRCPNLEQDFQINASETTINLIVPETINPYLFGKDNLGERYLLKSILNGFSLLQKVAVGSVTLDDLEIDRIVDLHAPLGIKKKIFLIDAGNDICLYPPKKTELRHIQQYNTNCILDEIVPRLVAQGIISGEPQVIEDQDDFLKDVTFKALLPWLNEELNDCDSLALIEHLYRQLEVSIYSRKMSLFTLPPTIACFENYDVQVQKLMKDDHSLTQTSVAIRCLLEHIIALPVNHGRIPSQSKIDHILAIMEQIIAWGMANDQVHFGLTDTVVDILPSGRIGTDHSLETEVFLPFRESHAKENISDSTAAFDEAFENRPVLEDSENPIMEKFDNAFIADYGFSLSQLLKFSNLLIGIGLQSDPDSICLMNENDLMLKTREVFTDKSDDEIKKLLDYYSLSERKSFFKPPKGFENQDMAPWRFNRGLSLLRKPMLKIQEDGKEPIYIWGSRQVDVAANQISSLLMSGKLRCKEDGALGILKGELLHEKGTRFTRTVFDYLKSELDDCILDIEVPIRPGAELNAPNDIGDVDVFIIDKGRKMLFLIECKNTSVAKTIKEIVEEVENLFGTESEKGWIKKHEERLDWIKGNYDLVSKKYNINIHDFQIQAVVLTSVQLPTRYLKKTILPFPMVSFYDVKTMLLDAFL